MVSMNDKSDQISLEKLQTDKNSFHKFFDAFVNEMPEEEKPIGKSANKKTHLN